MILFSCDAHMPQDLSALDPERATASKAQDYIVGTWVCTNIPEQKDGPPKFKERLTFLPGGDRGQVIISRSTDSPGDASKTDGYVSYTGGGHIPEHATFEICRKSHSNNDSFYWIIHMPWEGKEILSFGSQLIDQKDVLAVRRASGPRFKGDYVRQSHTTY